MDFKLKRPCANCPFRTDRPAQQGWLGEDRAAEISGALTHEGKTFQCHKTLDQKRGSHCAGALIMLEKSGLAASNQMIRISERLGLYDHGKLDMSAPVFGDPDEFIGWHAN